MKNQQPSYTASEPTVTRRYDLDWLRVIAFAVLILYHIGMYYVTDWSWHIKSDVTSTLLQDLMIFTNPWRMALLFFIGGVAFASISERYANRFTLAWLRTKRLFIPLLFGMFIVVSPQVYIEFLDRGLINTGFLEFWLQYINPNTNLLAEKQSVIGLLTWNHLWFLPYLWCYSLLMLTLVKPLKRMAESEYLSNTSLFTYVIVLMAMLIFVWLQLRTLFPTTHDLLNDWYSHGKYFLAFIAGCFLFWQKHWWQQAIQTRYWLLVIAVISYAFIIADRHGAFPEMAELFQTNLSVKMIYGVILSANIWCWILAAVGLTGHFLNKPNKLLSYANKSVLPWYLLHQTIIVVLAWWFKSFGLPVTIEVVLIVMLTVLSCLLGGELIRRSKVLSYMSGVRQN